MCASSVCMDSEHAVPNKSSRHTLRLTYSFSGRSDIELVDARRVEMRAPPASVVGVEDERRLTGFWYEARDDRGAILYRRVIPDPVMLSVEVPADEQHALTHGDPAGARGEFTVLVPELDGIRAVIVMGGDPEKAEPARELVRTDIKDALERFQK